MEKKISNIYKNAQKDISEKWDKFMKSHYPKLKDAQEKLKEAEKSGDKDKIKDARDVYERTAKNITVNNRRYQSMVNDVTNKLANTNQIALDYINGEMPSIYTINYNSFGDEKIKGYSFSLVNENAIKELATKDELLVPHKDLDIDKDKRWNAKNINSQVFQGILQGESIPKMAKRLMNVTNMNENSAIRNARTMTTSAENKGRQDSFKKAESDGVIMEREWVAAHDDRTRAWHLDLHGVRVGVDEPWENEYGKIMYPGDPEADAANVYNCRCAIRAHVKGFAWNKEDIVDSEAKEVQETNISKSTVVNGKDISDSWQRRADEFDFEIEDVINAQGFDGLPRVVNAEEFDKAVKESKFIAQRTYSAPNQETLDAYREQLYNGKWYVDCSTGGAQHGQGMYTAGNYEGKLTDAIKQEMKDYQSQNLSYSGSQSVHTVETMTLDPSAKIINQKDLVIEWAKDYDPSKADWWNQTGGPDNIRDAAIDVAKEIRKKELIKEGIASNDFKAGMMLSNDTKGLSISEEQNYWLKKAEDAHIATDNGSYAVLKGYDAIKTVHGTSGADTIILNRTKVIFKGE